ncbi:MAG: methyltransferase domain-containing protein [Thermomicrobiales bacterium]
MTDRVQHIYNDIAPQWDARQGLVERKLMGEGMRRALAQELRGRVLELGTGTGATLPFAIENPAITAFTGTDLSSGMLAQARAKWAALTQTHPAPFAATFTELEATRLPFPDASFDTVTASLMLCTVPDPAQTLREMASVCTPDGHIVLLEHVRAPNPLLAGMQKMLTPVQERMLGCHLDRPTDRIVRDLGFRVEREETRFFRVFHLIVARPPAEGASP